MWESDISDHKIIVANQTTFQTTLTWLKLTKKTPEQCVRSVQS